MLDAALAGEVAFSVQQISAQWNLSPDTVRSLFDGEPGVMHITTPSRKRRKYVTLRVPQSVVTRVYRKLAQ